MAARIFLYGFLALGVATVAFPQQPPGQMPGQLPSGKIGVPQVKPILTPSNGPPPNVIEQVQPELAPVEDGAPIFRDNVLNVMVPVTVVDKSSNKFVNGLTPLDFELYDNGRRQRITEDVAAHPISLAIVVQASANMEQILPNVRKMGSLLNTLVLGEFGEVAIVAYDHRIQTMSPFTNNPDQVIEALKKIKPGSNSARLNDATMEAVNMLRRRPTTRKRIVLLISETRDYGSEIHVRDVLTSMEFANVVAYSIDVSHLLTSLTAKALPPRPNGVPIEGRRQPDGSMATYSMDSATNFGNWTPVVKEIMTQVKGIFVKNPLEVYTRYTGGREYSFLTQKAFEQAVSDIGEELHSQYLLTYNPNNQDEAGFHEIRVRVLKPEMDVRKRDGYWLAGGKAKTP